jgi:HPt (histidine-containing phosphotransfer) domain-containing protein
MRERERERASTLDGAVLDELRALGREICSDVVGEVIEAFATSAPALVEDLRRRAAACDLEGARRAAHTLKSSSLQVGAQRLSGLARQAEAEAQEGRGGRLAHLTGQISDELSAVIAALRRTAKGT